MSIALITGSCGLVGSESVDFFIEKGLVVIGLDNNLRYEFSEREIVARNQYHIAWFIYENDFFHYSQGLMTESVWQAKLKAFEHWYNMCSMRDLYQRRSVWMPAAFRELIESFPDKC